MVFDSFYLVFTGLLNLSPHQHYTFGYVDDVKDDGDATLVKLTSGMLSFTGGVRVQLILEQHKAALISTTNDASPLLALDDTAVETEII